MPITTTCNNTVAKNLLETTWILGAWNLFTHTIIAKATPIGNYVSGPSPASIFGNDYVNLRNAEEIHGKYPHQILKKTEFRILLWVTTNMLNLTD